jgi:hypothetical protein
MWIVISIIILVVIISFLSAVNKQGKRVLKEGGMRHKYQILIDLLLNEDPKIKIYRITNTSVIIGLSSISGSTFFTINQTFRIVTIQWKIDSAVFGKHSLEWEFDEYMDQTKMFDRILNDLEKYQNNIMSAKGFSV